MLKKNIIFVLVNKTNMKYSISEHVLVKNTLSVKKIIDREIIDNIEIYYMEDKTCFPESQIFIDNKIVLNNLIQSNVDFFVDNLFDWDAIRNHYKKYKENSQ